MTPAPVLVVRGGDVLTPEGRMRVDVVVRDGRISSWRAAQHAEALADARVLDATGLVVAPGFIDLQCNGAGGIDLTTDPEGLWEVAALLPRWGVTSWLPTIVSSPEAIRRRALAVLTAGPPDPPDPPSGGDFSDPERLPGNQERSKNERPGDVGVGAVPLGLHFEGPFLAPERRGAHTPAWLRAPDPAVIDGWSRSAGVALVTLAPELPGALDLVHELVDRRVAVSLGHSSATAAQATAAVDAGARMVTHVFSAMAGLHHREPGLVGVALTDERLTVGLIADGVHVHPTAVALAARALGSRLALVTDAVAALGEGTGRRPLRLGDLEALADDTAVRLPDGTLAGSVLSLDRAVGNLMAFAGVSLEDAVRAVTATPARLLGLDAERGAIAPGMVGDLVLLDVSPTGVEVVSTVIAGTPAFPSEPSEPEIETEKPPMPALLSRFGEDAPVEPGRSSTEGSAWRS